MLLVFTLVFTLDICLLSKGAGVGFSRPQYFCSGKSQLRDEVAVCTKKMWVPETDVRRLYALPASWAPRPLFFLTGCSTKCDRENVKVTHPRRTTLQSILGSCAKQNSGADSFQFSALLPPHLYSVISLLESDLCKLTSLLWSSFNVFFTRWWGGNFLSEGIFH